MVILKDSYINYKSKPAAPAHHNIIGGYTVDTTTRWKNEHNFWRCNCSGQPCLPVYDKSWHKETLTRSHWIRCTRCDGHTKGIQPKGQEDYCSIPHGQEGRQWWGRGDRCLPEMKILQEHRSKEKFKPHKNHLQGTFYRLQVRIRTRQQLQLEWKIFFQLKLQNHMQEDCFKRTLQGQTGSCLLAQGVHN